MENSTLNDRLKRYSAFAAAATAAAPAIGQVVYTDLSPDIILNINDTYALNLDGDAQDDFYFGVFSASGTYYGGLINYSMNIAGVYGATGASFMGQTSSFGNMVSGLYAGMSVSSLGAFMNSSAALGGYVVVTGIYSTSTPIGDFNPNERYMGVQFDISGSTHYGWVRARVTPNGDQMVIFDYAYESTAGASILTGDTGAGMIGVDELDVSSMLNIRAFQGDLIIDAASELTNATIRVMDLTGKVVMNENLNSGTTTHSLDALSTGVYMVNVIADQGVHSQKIYR